MGFFNRKKVTNQNNEDKLSSEIERIFCKLSKNQEASKKVDKAISYRELGEYDRSIKILKDIINQYPAYFPAKNALGVTLLRKGDFKQAEWLFLNIAKDSRNGSEKFPLTDVYANLGVIRWKNYDDIDGAIKFYKLAIADESSPEIDQKTYEMVRSGPHRDLCWLYFGKQDLKNAMYHAKKRLDIVSDCIIASKVLGISLVSEFLNDKDNIRFCLQDIKPNILLYSAKFLETCYNQNEDEFSVLGNLTLVYVFLGMTSNVRNNADLLEKCSVKAKYYSNILYKYSERSDYARQVQSYFESIVGDFMKKINALGKS
jgi:tetratricopeptide (TPR) repeat protein